MINLAEFIRIRSVKQYFQEFAVDAIGKKHADSGMIKEQLLDAFRREIFDQITAKYKDPELLAKDAEDTSPEVREGVNNILKNSMRKWRRLCIVFSQYRETANLLFPDDLMKSMQEIVDVQTGELKTLEDEDIKEEN